MIKVGGGDVLDSRQLQHKLSQINGKGYKAYKEIQGEYQFADFVLFIDHVQGDPFASPSRIRIRVSQGKAQFPSELFHTPVRKVALEDYLTRMVHKCIAKEAKGRRGTGKSGMLGIDRCGQEVLPRTSMVINKDYVEARLVIGLPARGRTVLGYEAAEMFFAELPRVVKSSLLYKSLNGREVAKHVETVEDQDYIRKCLLDLGMVAFIANGSILPRKSGVSDEPMTGKSVIPFKAPAQLEVNIDTPNRGEIVGMGIPAGVTLIVGGGYHGKSTLLKAIERGVYNHIPGDGREYVVTVESAVKIRAEDGRSVCQVDISPFIANLPYGQDTSSFSTADASGSTSQAANIMEALEVGSQLLLLDEDTSATNFMIRDVRMQQLVAKEKEPITPFIDKVTQLKQELGVSTILVVGGSGDYFDVADNVIMMDEYIPHVVTSKAKAIAASHATNRHQEGGETFGQVVMRTPMPGSIDPTKGRKIKIDAKDVHHILFGTDTIQLLFVEQLVDISQTRAIGDAIFYAANKYFNGRETLNGILERLISELEGRGLDILSPFYGKHPGYYAMPRKYEIAAAINRLRSIRMRQLR